MSVTWLWKNKMGSIQWQTISGKKINVNAYQGNCLCVMIHTYKQDGKAVYDFCGFFNDESHLKKCIGLAKDYDGKIKNIYENEWLKWKLNTYYKQSFTLAKYLTKAGYKVELYYEEVK